MNKIRLDYTRNLIILSSKNKNYFLSRLGIFYFLLFFLAVTNNTPLIAEGTKSIAPSTADETALFIGGGNTGFTGGSYGLFAWKGSDSKLAFNIQSIQEKVYLGFSIPKNNREFQDSGGAGLVEDLIFRILDQDGVPISCFGNTTINGEVWQTLSSTDANISSRAMADNGPVQLGNVGGYTAFVLDLTTCGQKTGNYFIEFYTTDASYNPNIQGAGFYVEYFDITVAEPINSIITPITGRVWSNNWCLSLKRDGDGPFDRAFNGAFYVCSIEGFVTKINFNSGVNNRPEAGNNDQRSGFRAGTFNVSFNTTGPANTGDIIADRKSLQDLNSPNAELFVFLNEPDESFCPTQEVGEIKARTEFLTGCPLSFCINIEANKKGQIEVLIEGADSNGILDQPTERFLAYNIMDTDSVDNPDNPGFNYSFCLPWDGKDGLGNQQNLANMSIRAAFSQGVYHFPVYDAEFNDDGFTVETIRPALGPQKLFYDDTMISEANNTGEPKDGSNGCTAPCHRWTGEWGNIADKDEVYGNFNTINTWWFANTGANDLTSFIKRIKPPNLICPANVNDCPGTSTDPSVTGLATSPDDANCPVIIDYSDVVEDTLCGAKTITRTWKAYFQGIPEPSTTCIQIIKLEDIIAPIPPAPPVNMVGQCAAAVPASVSLTATDNCDGEITADPVDVRTDRDCANNFTIVRTWTFADACGNSSSITQNITVNDTIAPIPPAPPADFVGQCDSDMPPVVNLTATDNCDGEITAGSIDVRTDGNCDNSYTLVRTWTFFDACGNSSSVSQNITINDTIAPVPPAPPADVLGQCAADVPAPVSLTATDNCDGAITADPVDVRTDGNCANNFTIVRTWTFADACGNSSSITQNITVNDTIAPIPPAPPEDILVCLDDPPPPVSLTAVDNCDRLITVDPVDEVMSETRTIRTWTFIDDCGNSSSISQEISICEPRIIFDTYCTFTQGFYGNPGGKFDGKTTTEILDAALAQGPIIIGQPGRSLTINSSKCILKLLPGGGVSTVLPVGEVIVGNNCSPAPIATKKNGTIGNILIAQVITLTINTRVDGNLNTLPLENLCFEVPQNILIALPPNPDVGDLLTYANAVLAGAAVQNLLAVNDVVTAVNESFDECAAPCNLPDDSMKINLSDDSVIKNDFSKPEPISEVYEKRTFSIAPNPAFTSTFIDLHQFEGEKVRLIINTQMGQKVYEKTLQVNAEYKKEMIDVELLTNGLYFISVRSEEDPIIYTKKFVVRQVR